MAAFRDIESARKRARSSYRDPKKHYVRMEGWLPVFQRYAKLRKEGVRYLTLCAKSAIDVRYFRLKGLLPYDSDQKNYPTVSFIEGDPQDFATIAETLGSTRLGLRGSFEEIVLDSTGQADAHRDLMATFPYEIVNLDFTGDVVPHRDAPYSSTIRAIERLIRAQHDTGIETWHLFLTFRARKTTANDEANSQLKDILDGNLVDEAAKRAYGGRQTPEALLASDYKEFLRIGTSKFLAYAASHNGYKLNLEQSYYYPRRAKGGGEKYFIVKLVAEFSQVRIKSHIPNPATIDAAYKDSVIQVFSSSSIDVYNNVGRNGYLQNVMADLAPVLRELESIGLES